jgi:hypothetical protein
MKHRLTENVQSGDRPFLHPAHRENIAKLMLYDAFLSI